MSESGAPARSARPLIDAAVQTMGQRIEETSGTVTDAIHANVEALGEDLYHATHRSTRANVGLITTMVNDHADPTAFTVPEEALAYARSYVPGGLSFGELTSVYRQGQQAYLKLWIDELVTRAESPADLAVAVEYFSDWLFRWIEKITGELGLAYSAERERWIRGSVALRTEEVRSILAGTHTDIVESSGRLRYRLDATHLGFVIWDESPVGESELAAHPALFADMDRYASEISQSLGATSSLAVPIGRCYAGWVAIACAPEPDAVPAGHGSLRVALGRPGRGVEGFRTTHEQARLARRVVTLRRRSAQLCTSFDSVALDALLSVDVDMARQFVEHELGPLIDDSDATRRIAATVEVFLQEDSSYVRAARRLGVHENTVTYRVKRAEELLGRRTTERQLELRAALRLARLLPPRG